MQILWELIHGAGAVLDGSRQVDVPEELAKLLNVQLCMGLDCFVGNIRPETVLITHDGHAGLTCLGALPCEASPAAPFPAAQPGMPHLLLWMLPSVAPFWQVQGARPQHQSPGLLQGTLQSCCQDP